MLGGDGDDTLRGSEGDDHLTGGSGDDVIQGGEGLDFSHFNGRFEDYKISGTKDEFIVTDTVDGGDGVDRLSEVEFLVFKGLAVTQIGLEAIVDDGSEATSLRIDSRNDIDDDDVINPLSDGLIIATSALAIEVAAGDELAPWICTHRAAYEMLCIMDI